MLEIRTLRMPRLYDIAWEKPPPLVERYLRLVVDERIDAKGARRSARSTAPTPSARSTRCWPRASRRSPSACSTRTPIRRTSCAIKDDRRSAARPSLPLCIRCEVLPEIKEYERTSTTVINAYVLPIVATLPAPRCAQGLDAIGIAAPLLLMQSNGGLTTDAAAVERPMHIIESGPAGGVVGAQALARAIGLRQDHHLRHGRHHRQGLASSRTAR